MDSAMDYGFGATGEAPEHIEEEMGGAGPGRRPVDGEQLGGQAEAIPMRSLFRDGTHGRTVASVGWNCNPGC